MGIEEESGTDRFNIFPNPSSNQFTIYDLRFTIESVEVYDVLGQLQTSNFKPQTNSIDVSSLRSGIYFITITDDAGKKIVRKVVKM